MTTKNFRFLQDYKFSRQVFENACMDILGQSIEESQYKDNRDEIMDYFINEFASVVKRIPERLPLISSILTILSKYGDLLDNHPTINTVKHIFIPEIVDVIDQAVFQYITNEDSYYQYNHYCINAVRYRFKKYRKNIIKYSGELKNRHLDEHSTKLA